MTHDNKVFQEFIDQVMEWHKGNRLYEEVCMAIVRLQTENDKLNELVNQKVSLNNAETERLKAESKAWSDCSSMNRKIPLANNLDNYYVKFDSGEYKVVLGSAWQDKGEETDSDKHKPKISLKDLGIDIKVDKGRFALNHSKRAGKTALTSELLKEWTNE